MLFGTLFLNYAWCPLIVFRSVIQNKTLYDLLKLISGAAFRKGKKIARWFTSSILKDSDQALGDFPPSTEVRLCPIHLVL